MRTGERGRAFDVLDRIERTAVHLERPQLDAIADAIEHDPADNLARWALAAGDPAYERAFHKLMRNPTAGMFEWDEAERAALPVGSSCSGRST